MLTLIMRIVAYSSIRAHGAKHPNTIPSLRRWHKLLKQGRWRTMQEVVATFGTAKSLSGDRCRFAIHGGNCRLIVSFNFDRQIAYIKFIGSHQEYDEIDTLTISQF